MAVEAEAGIDAAFQHVVEDEIEGEQFRQLVAHDLAGAPGGEMRGHAFRRHCFGDGGVERGIAADQRDVEPVAFVTAARMGEPIERNVDPVMPTVSTNVTCGATLLALDEA